jgi:two-component system response regulator (stage 0 sporulation protein F)
MLLSQGMGPEALRILTVDDEPSVNLSMRYIFSGPHHEVVGVNSGEAALAQLDTTTSPFDVIIIDEKMPKLSGVELVRAIRERQNPAKIIVVSANLSQEICEAYERLNVHVMFSKPFDVHVLRSTVDRLVT